jgi:hypothetical protein
MRLVEMVPSHIVVFTLQAGEQRETEALAKSARPLDIGHLDAHVKVVEHEPDGWMATSQAVARAVAWVMVGSW